MDPTNIKKSELVMYKYIFINDFTNFKNNLKLKNSIKKIIDKNWFA